MENLVVVFNTESEAYHPLRYLKAFAKLRRPRLLKSPWSNETVTSLKKNAMTLKIQRRMQP